MSCLASTAPSGRYACECRSLPCLAWTGPRLPAAQCSCSDGAAAAHVPEPTHTRTPCSADAPRVIVASCARAADAVAPSCSGQSKETRGTAYVVYEDIYDAKQAADHLSGFNVQNRWVRRAVPNCDAVSAVC
jgi:hypothetical protein